jgi:hypothetical protein
MVSVKCVVLGAYHHQSCCKVGGSAQPDPYCDSGMGRERKKSGNAGVLKVRRGIGNHCVAFYVRWVARNHPQSPANVANHPMLPPVPCTRFPVVGPLLS